MLPVCDLAMPSNDVMAAPRSLVRARNTARFSSATSARSSWSTIWSLSLMELSVSSWAVSSRPNGSRSPYGISASMSMPSSRAAGRAPMSSPSSGPSCGSSRRLLATKVEGGTSSCSAGGSSSTLCSRSSSGGGPWSPSSAELLSIRNMCRMPLANFDSGSDACSSTASTTFAGAAKASSSMFPSACSERRTLSTSTSLADTPVACTTPCTKRSSKSGGSGPPTEIWPRWRRTASWLCAALAFWPFEARCGGSPWACTAAATTGGAPEATTLSLALAAAVAPWSGAAARAALAFAAAGGLPAALAATGDRAAEAAWAGALAGSVPGLAATGAALATCRGCVLAFGCTCSTSW
mmetsp:Transcript_38808/g.101127  ORF Transcript_38808/g.101127 Transcript_38808/m.101127 type:complete len:352 (+) Transcript_38808:264-1319(+)